MKTIILTGGGTAGHVFGNIALLFKLETFFDKIIYVGGSGIEKQILKNFKNITYFEIKAPKFERKLTLKNLAIPFSLLKSIFACKKIIKQAKPDVIFSKGGFVSLPVVLAGASKKVPILIHESDLSLGLANKIAKNKAKIVFTTFKETAKNLKNGVWSGPPIRSQIFCGNKEKARQQFHIPQNLPVLLVIGGSLGARFLNELVKENFEFLCEMFFVVHITGNGKSSNLEHKNYFQCQFLQDIENILAVTDFVVSRSGSNAIFEFLALKIPMLLVPLSKKVSRGDQIENAKHFKKQGFAEILMEEDKNNFKNILKNLLKNEKKMKEKMKNFKIPNTLDLIFDEIKKCAKVDKC